MHCHKEAITVRSQSMEHIMYSVILLSFWFEASSLYAAVTSTVYTVSVRRCEVHHVYMYLKDIRYVLYVIMHASTGVVTFQVTFQVF